MPKQFFRVRSGITLIELLIYMGIMGIVVGITLPLFFRTAENRVLQQTISVVEQNGTQVLETVSLRIRNAESVVYPARGETGSVLVLKTSDQTTDPTIIGLSSGSIIIVRHTTRESITSTQVAIENFVVRNTSMSADSLSVQFSFDASRTIRLQQPYSYRRYYQASVSLFPDSIQDIAECGCALPACVAGTSFEWGVCENSECYLAETDLECG